MLRPVLVLAATLLWFGTAQAQPPIPTGPAAAFTPIEADFTATFPVTPQAASKPMAGVQGGSLRTYGATTPEEAYSVTVLAYPRGTISGAMTDAAFAQIINTFADGAGAKVRAITPTTVAGRPGAQAVLDDPETHMVVIMRVTQQGDRIYNIVYGGPAGSETGARGRAFLESFRLTGR